MAAAYLIHGTLDGEIKVFGIIGGAYREILRNGMPQLDVA